MIIPLVAGENQLVSKMNLGKHDLAEAEEAIRKKLFKCSSSKRGLTYDPAAVVETENWWYLPILSIGSKGFIVNKTDLYVNCLGSGLGLHDCFWGHEHGLFCDLVDFTFHKRSDLNLVRRLVLKFQHMHPNSAGRLPKEPVWYRESEIDAAVSSQFPTFKRHFVWFAIRDLHDAWVNAGLRFKSSLVSKSE